MTFVNWKFSQETTIEKEPFLDAFSKMICSPAKSIETFYLETMYELATAVNYNCRKYLIRVSLTLGEQQSCFLDNRTDC